MLLLFMLQRDQFKYLTFVHALSNYVTSFKCMLFVHRQFLLF
jgi:hypothetical protein